MDKHDRRLFQLRAWCEKPPYPLISASTLAQLSQRYSESESLQRSSAEPMKNSGHQLKTGVSCVLSCLISTCELYFSWNARGTKVGVMFATSLTKMSCSHLCFIMGCGGLKETQTHHVSLLTSTETLDDTVVWLQAKPLSMFLFEQKKIQMCCCTSDHLSEADSEIKPNWSDIIFKTFSSVRQTSDVKHLQS